MIGKPPFRRRERPVRVLQRKAPRGRGFAIRQFGRRARRALGENLLNALSDAAFGDAPRAAISAIETPALSWAMIFLLALGFS
jgi:hypothetical protein